VVCGFASAVVGGVGLVLVASSAAGPGEDLFGGRGGAGQECGEQAACSGQPDCDEPGLVGGGPGVDPHHTGRAARRGHMLADMTIRRMDNVAIVVDDLDAAVAFFTELGMEVEGKGQVEGLFADRTVGLDGVRSDIAMMRTPDGHSKLELTKYHTPAAVGAQPQNPPPNTLGLHRVMFAVDDINDTVARLRAHGAELLGEVAQYESIFLLCYLRGPAGIIVALAEQIG
jgi:catechol 2,3-dioxygenase-like lactoylglutathione lyase family enzyme